MKSPQITSGRVQKASAGWIHGVNSVRNPWALPEDQIKWAQNCAIRGGIGQTRNGFRMKLSLPKGNFQGGVIFAANKQYEAASTNETADGQLIFTPQSIYTPDGKSSQEFEIPYLVFAVDGVVYYAPFPLTQPADWAQYKLTNIRLNADVKRVNFVIATQSAIVSSGDVTVTPSHRLVIVQDGVSQPCYWDGSNKTGNVATKMPVGYWMAYSGSRLWLASGNIISASDLGDPLSWEERKSGTGRGDFSVPRPVTAMVDYIGQNTESRLYVFTDRATYSLASGILDRTLWPQTANFQTTLYPNIGCVAGKSIAFQAGMMWWFSQGGLVSVDVAAASYLSSQVLYKDIEMAKAKRLMAPDLSGICCAAFENYLLTSIPYAEPLNSATMVLDYAAASEWNQSRSPAWAGVWTGIRPIEWLNAYIGNEPKLFALSVDYAPTGDQSFNHVWEAFRPERYDTYLEIRASGTVVERQQRIYCQVETALMGDGMDLKQLVYGEVDCSQIAGTVDVKISYRGTKGAYNEILTQRILAATNVAEYKNSPDYDKVKDFGLLQTQSRRLITRNIEGDARITSCESKDTQNVDKAFSYLIEWCGALGVEGVRMFQDPWAERSVGGTKIVETKYCVVGENGQSALIDIPAATELPVATQWLSTQTRTYTDNCVTGGPKITATATASAVSVISQADADSIAAAKALREATVAAKQQRLSRPCS